MFIVHIVRIFTWISSKEKIASPVSQIVENLPIFKTLEKPQLYTVKRSVREHVILECVTFFSKVQGQPDKSCQPQWSINHACISIMAGGEEARDRDDKRWWTGAKLPMLADPLSAIWNNRAALLAH